MTRREDYRSFYLLVKMTVMFLVKAPTMQLAQEEVLEDNPVLLTIRV